MRLIGMAHSDTYGQSFVLVFGATGTPWPTRLPAPVITATSAGYPSLTGPATLGTATATLTPPATRTYTAYIVQRGDTLFIIATRYGTTVDKLAAINGISNPDVIEVGQVILIP